MTNLFINGDFEHYYLWRGTAGLQVAHGWTPWWLEQTGEDPAWKNRRPEFQRASIETDPTRVRQGESAQQIHSFWGTHTAGLWQQVVVAPGSQLHLKAWGHAWSSEADKPRPSQNPTHVHMRVGIDPLGGTDPTSGSVVWSSEQNAIDRWTLFSVLTQANTDVVTVFLRSSPDWPKKHQHIFWDEAALEVVEGAGEPLAFGGDRYTRFEVEPAVLAAGKEGLIHVLTPTHHLFPSLTVRTPASDGVLLPEPDRGRRGEEHLWTFRFRPERLGAHLMTFGSDAGSRVICWATLEVGGGPFQPPPAALPVEEPAAELMPGRGLPRVQFCRTYVLLPPTADSVWAEAAMRGGFDARRTVGFSADDAGLGDLADRRVIAINPHHWPHELTADWFDHHYPGVKFHALIVDTPEELARALRNWRD